MAVCSYSHVKEVKGRQRQKNAGVSRNAEERSKVEKKARSEYLYQERKSDYSNGHLYWRHRFTNIHKVSQVRFCRHNDALPLYDAYRDHTPKPVQKHAPCPSYLYSEMCPLPKSQVSLEGSSRMHRACCFEKQC